MRPTIDVAALERFLAAAPPSDRTAALLACANHLTAADVAALGVPVPPAPLAPFIDPETGERLGMAWAAPVPIGFVPTFDDPELRRLWDAVEPGGPQPPESVSG